jgi:hypothetical protein
MCCGQKRRELRNSSAQSSVRPLPKTLSGNGRAQTVRTQPPSHSTTPALLSHPPGNGQLRSIQPQISAPVSAPQSSINLRYVETSPIRVRGLVSGVSYEFSGTAPVQQVDARDAPSLLTTRFFRRA